MKHIIFDDHKRDNFYPLTLNRSSGDLRTGILKLRQRIAGYLETGKYSLIVHNDLSELYRERHPKKDVNRLNTGDSLFINSRLIISDEWVKKIKSLPPESCIADGEIIIAARMNIAKEIDDVSASGLPELLSGLQKIGEAKSACWEYIWELIGKNGDYIGQDFEDFFVDEDNHYDIEPGVTVLNPYNIWIGENVELKPGAVIDASEGAVVLDEGCRIMHNAVIVGPAYIGKRSTVRAAARIYEGTSIGPVCKVGGEIEGTIFQGYSNKQHDGFLGHSYLGEWINLGANTNNSDLKNNYKNAAVYFHPEKKKIDSGSLFAGSIIGDHSKTAISMTINTGTVIGIGCNLIGNTIIKDHIPSFSWGDCNNLQPYRLEPFFETAEKVKLRRKLRLSEAEKRIYTQISRESEQ